MTDVKCDVCGGDVWDNRETKKNPKAPDYKCKNRECGRAIWINSFKDKYTPPEVKAPPKAEPKIEPRALSNGNNIDAMVLSYAKDIVVALIDKEIFMEDIIGKVKELYKGLRPLI